MLMWRVLYSEARLNPTLNKPKSCIRPNTKICVFTAPDRPYFSAADPNLFYRQLLDPNFC
jgi:hypothetical protein